MQSRLRPLFSLLIVLTLGVNAMAAPAITSTAGVIGTNNTLQINGSAFGTKTRSKAVFWADGQDGSIQPHATLSFKTTWNTFKIATTTVAPRWGSHTFISTFDGTLNASKFQGFMPSATYGTKLYTGFWRKADFAYTGNWKEWRCWAPGGSKNFPNAYLGDDTAETLGDVRVAVEDDTFVNSINRTYGPYLFPNSTWRFEEIFVQLNSAVGVNDGTIIVKVNGQTVISDTSFRFNSAAYPLINYTDFQIQDQWTHVVPATNHVWKDSIYIDDSWNRVYIGNASTYATSTHFELQPYTAWNSGQITISQRLGSLTGNKYLYVCDNNNSCNANGYFLASGGTPEEPPPEPLPAPTITSVTPNTGPAAGGTAVSLSGTDLVDGLVLKVGGTSVAYSFVSSGALTFTTPAGSGQSIVLVTNPDGQSASLNYFTYDAALPVPPSTAQVFPWANP